MIIIPMAGLSRRFREAGYAKPKYMLMASEHSLFAHSVGSFQAYFSELPFLFIYRDVLGTDDFVRSEVEKLRIRDSVFVSLPQDTLGQADTVFQGLRRAEVADKTPITIFNIDTIRRNFTFPESKITEADGYLEVFEGEGSNWSFVGPDSLDPGRVLRTTEKDPISNLCSTGLYHFSQAGDFCDAFSEAFSGGDKTRNEYYVAPLYNRLIEKGREIRYNVIRRDDVVFSGVPQEYVDFCQALGCQPEPRVAG